MSSQELLAEIQKLPPEERRRLLEALTHGGPVLPEPQLPITEDDVEEMLLAQGIIGGIPPRLPDEDEESYEPIEVPGLPLSETVIEERR